MIDVTDAQHLRGKAALTVIRGNPGRHVYRNEIVDARQVWPEDLERLTSEGFLEWVVKDGENYVLAADSDDAKAGDSVTVGSTSADVSPTAQRAQGADPADPGLTNKPATVEITPNEPVVDDTVASPLPADGSAPPQNASKATWVAYAKSKGMDEAEAGKASKADLIAALKS